MERFDVDWMFWCFRISCPGMLLFNMYYKYTLEPRRKLKDFWSRERDLAAEELQLQWPPCCVLPAEEGCGVECVACCGGQHSKPDVFITEKQLQKRSRNQTETLLELCVWTLCRVARWEVGRLV
jgi:hypothetical protein